MLVITKALPTTCSPTPPVPVTETLISNSFLHPKEPGLHAGQLTPGVGKVKTAPRATLTTEYFAFCLLKDA